MYVRGPNNVGRSVQTDLTFLCYVLAITEQKKCYELLAPKFGWFQTLRNVGSYWSTMLRPFAGA